MKGYFSGQDRPGDAPGLGSHGFDQSLDYTLQLQVSSSLLGGGADRTIAGLGSKAGRAGVNHDAAPEIPLQIERRRA